MPRFFFVLLLLVVAGVCLAEEPAHPKQDLTFELRCVVLPQELAIPLVNGLRSTRPADKTAALAKLDEFIAKGSAALVGWPMLTVHAGQKATIESIEEVRYATEFDPGGNSFYYNASEESVPPAVREASNVKTTPLITTFETRNVGLTLEIQATIQADGKAASVDLVANHIRLNNVDRLTIEKQFLPEGKSEKVIQEQPRFSDARVNTGFYMEDREQKVIGLFSVRNEPGKIEIFLLGLEIHPVRK